MGLLYDKILKGLNGFNRVAMGLGTPDVLENPAMAEQAGGDPANQQALKAARDSAVAKMIEASSRDVPWYSLTSIRNSVGQQAYDSALDDAFKRNAYVKNEERKKRLNEMINGAMSSSPGSKPMFTPEQQLALSVLDDAAQQKAISDIMFPDPNSSINRMLLKKFVRLDNGNLGVVIQTNRPDQPFEVRDTGVRDYETATAAMKTAADYAIHPERYNNQAYGTKEAEESGKRIVDQRIATTTTINQLTDYIAQTKNLREIIASGPETGFTGPVKAKWLQNYQVVQAASLRALLTQLEQMKASGSSLSPMSNADIEMIKSAIANIKNGKYANLTIIDYDLKRLERLLQQNQNIYEKLQQDGARPDQLFTPSGVSQPAPSGPTQQSPSTSFGPPGSVRRAPYIPSFVRPQNANQ